MWRNWQTHKTKDLMKATSCRFKSCHPHQNCRFLREDGFFLAKNRNIFRFLYRFYAVFLILWGKIWGKLNKQALRLVFAGTPKRSEYKPRSSCSLRNYARSKVTLTRYRYRFHGNVT